VRLIAKSLLAIVLAGCGGPGSDSVFTKNNPKIAPVDSSKPVAVKVVQPPRPVTKRFTGYYRKVGDESQFQPCGTSAPIDIYGPAIARGILKERFRWYAVWEGAKMYAVFQGAIVTDTPMIKGITGDSTRGAPRNRFYLVDIDSLRVWRNTDCNGMRLPRGISAKE
jgi:hypothetical protein